MNTHNILSVQISDCSYEDFLQSTLMLPEQNKSSYVCFANVHMLIEGNKDPTYLDIINNADLVAPDGKPVAMLLDLATGKHHEKISGPDFFPDLLYQCSKKRKTVFFYGSSVSVLDKLTKRIKFDFPELNIKGFFSPPFRELNKEEDDKVISMINESAPDYIFVALGCPKQERWMAEHQGKISGCMLGVGQAFQIYAGSLARAPRWMQYWGLEWCFRLFSEPKRLWKRYLITNVYFLYLIFKKGLQSIRI